MNGSCLPSAEWRLFVQPAPGCASPSSGPVAWLAELAVTGPSTLALPPAAGAEAPAILPTLAPGSLVLEPFEINSLPRLLLWSPRPISVLVNGRAALSAVVFLQDKDVLQLGSFIMHLARYSQPVGKPPGALLGRKCPICLGPIADASLVYLCVCGVCLHYAPGDASPACVQPGGTCPKCQRPIVAEPAYSHVPQPL